MCLAEVNELVLPSLNCAISIPPGWAQIVVPNPNSRAFYKSPDGARTVILEVIEFGDARVEVDERFIAKRKEVENVAGSQLISERRFTMSGFPAYETKSRIRFQGTNVSSIQRIVIAGGRLYKIAVLFLEGDASSDKALQRYLNSFRFLTSPVSAAQAKDHRDPWATFGAGTGAVAIAALTIAAILAYIRQTRKLRSRKLSEM